MTRLAVAFLALALLAAPLVVEAQQPVKVYRIGSLGTFPPAPGPNPLGDAFLDGLREHGYVEGQNLTIERRSPMGRRIGCRPSSPTCSVSMCS